MTDGIAEAKNEENRRLLVIDDEAEIRQGYRSFLNPEQVPKLASSRADSPAPVDDPATYAFELTEAESGEQALEIVRSELAAGRKFAGAIVDVRMPGRIDGLQFLKQAWELDPDLMVVVVTAYQDRSVDDISRMFGARFQDHWDYLSKPFTSGEIVQKARNLVSGWNRRKRERQYLQTIREQQSALIAHEQLAAVGRVARAVGHDLGNILQQVLTKLEVHGEPEEAGLIEAVELGATICRDLLTFGRPSAASAGGRAVPLSEPIGKASRLLRQQLRRKDIKLDVQVDEQARCRGEESQLVQVFVNLMTNAIQAMKAGGALLVAVRRGGGGGPGEAWTVIVKDNGAGVDAAALPHVFEPLFTTKGEGGSGLGLAVCRQIVESYGGTISMESAPGKGTTVTVRLPAA